MIRINASVALYARYSSDNQRQESIDAQIRAMKQYCENKGYKIVKIYVDEAKSATTDQRPSFQQMISDSQKKEFEYLVVHKLDRFARNRYDAAIYRQALRKNGVAVVSVLENLDDSPESIILEAVLEGYNEYYSRNLARETMKGMRETAYQCKHTGGLSPLGFDIDPETKRLVINEKEAEAVRLIFQMYADGYGYSAIIKRLDEEGHLTKRGNKFSKNSLYDMLHNEKYIGRYVFNKSSSKNSNGKRNSRLHKDESEMICIEGGCPRIIDDDTFYKVQNKQNRPKHNASFNAIEHYLFAGVIRCGECGRAFCGNRHRTGRGKNLYATYRCTQPHVRCSNKEINKDKLEAYVIDLMEKQIFNQRSLKAMIKRIDKKRKSKENLFADSTKRLEEELAKTQTELNNVSQAIADGVTSKVLIDKLDQLEAKKAGIEEALKKVKEQTAHIELDADKILAQYNDLKRHPHSPTYRAFVQDFIEVITVGRFQVTVTLKMGLGVFPELNETFVFKRQEVYEREKSP